VSCKAISTAAFPNITPVDPPIVNINKNKREKYEEVTKGNAALPRYVLIQLKILVPVGRDIKIVTPVK
jgi:hypothetical protein